MALLKKIILVDYKNKDFKNIKQKYKSNAWKDQKEILT